ncbi:unnamed protein product, partial [Prorocentrum cordatum]
ALWAPTFQASQTAVGAEANEASEASGAVAQARGADEDRRPAHENRGADAAAIAGHILPAPPLPLQSKVPPTAPKAPTPDNSVEEPELRIMAKRGAEDLEARQADKRVFGRDVADLNQQKRLGMRRHLQTQGCNSFLFGGTFDSSSISGVAFASSTFAGGAFASSAVASGTSASTFDASAFPSSGALDNAAARLVAVAAQTPDAAEVADLLLRYVAPTGAHPVGPRSTAVATSDPCELQPEVG